MIFWQTATGFSLLVLDLGRGAHDHDVIATTSPQKNDLCTEELRDRALTMGTRSVYHLEKLERVVYFSLGERGLWN